MKEIRKQNRYRILLAQNFLFSGIDVSTVSNVFGLDDCSCMEFEPNEKIYTRTHFKRSMGIVLSGELKALKPVGEGPGLVLNTFSAGGVFGIACLFNNAKQYVSEVVAVKQSRVLFLPQSLLHSLFEQNPQIAENYIGYLSNRICFLNSRIDNFTGGSAECRLAGFLLSISLQSENPLQFELPCTFTQLSNTLDMGRASLYRAMDDLSAKGIISRSGKMISIIEVERLKTGLYE
jgi:CRP-like cAMP-binding protein